MAIQRGLRNELSKYRKRNKAGFAPAGPQGHFNTSRKYVSGTPYVPRGAGYHHDLYNWGMPRAYRPSLNAPAAQVNQYDPYEPLETHHVSKPGIPRLPHKLSSENHIMQTPTSFSADDLTLTEQFLMAMGKRDDIDSVPLEELDWDLKLSELSVPLPIEPHLTAETTVEQSGDDVVRKFMDITSALAHLQKALPDDHPDVVNLRTAFQDLFYDPELTSRLESIAGEDRPSKLGTGDPYAIDPLEEAAQLFDQQTQSVERAFDRPMLEAGEVAVPAMFDGQLEMQLEQLPGGALPETGGLERIVGQVDLFGSPAPEFLEQDIMLSQMAADMAMSGAIPEQDTMPEEMMADSSMAGPMPGPAVFDIDPAIDEINQAIDEVTQGSMQQEPEPDSFHPNNDPYMMNQDMFDQMQYMADPFVMPGPHGPVGPMPNPMTDPYMMPGPFGP